MMQNTILLGVGVAIAPPLCALCVTGSSLDVNIEQPVIPTGGPPTKRMKKASVKQELKTAAAIGGKRQPGSGSIPGIKGDVRLKGRYRIENKDTYSNTYRMTMPVLDKIRGECARGEDPALIVTFRDRATHAERESWAVVPFEDWQEMVNAAGKNR